MTSTDIISALIGLLEKYKAHTANISEHLPPVSLPQHADLKQQTADLSAEATDAVSEAKEHTSGIPSPSIAPPVDNDHIAQGITPFPTMRAKFLVSTLAYNAPGNDATAFSLNMNAVGGDKVQHGYPEDGVDEDNTFARWSPSGSLSLYVANPDLIGKIKEGEKYYLDFTLANPAPESSSLSSSESSSSSSSDSSLSISDEMGAEYDRAILHGLSSSSSSDSSESTDAHA